MSFRDHPVFDDHPGVGHAGVEATIIGFRDRRVRAAPGRDAPAPLPSTEQSRGRTAARLGKLPANDWCVVAGPPAGPDHLVIGTRGVYAITTTRLVRSVAIAGDVMLHDGTRTDHLSRVTLDARRVSARLGVVVRALLVVDADELVIRVEPLDAGVTSSTRVHKWLQRRPEELARDVVFRVATTAQRPSTWRAFG